MSECHGPNATHYTGCECHEREMHARIAELESALAPFARESRMWGAAESEMRIVPAHDIERKTIGRLVPLMRSDFTRAADVLKK